MDEEIRRRFKVPLASGKTAVATLCVPRLDGTMEARGAIAGTGEAFYVILPKGATYGDKASLAAIRNHCDALERRQAEQSSEAESRLVGDALDKLTFDLLDENGKAVNGSVLIRSKVTGVIVTRAADQDAPAPKAVNRSGD